MTSDHNPPGAAETGGAVELLACWFCGKSDAFVERDDLTSAYVMCNACGARGPSGCQDSDDEEIPGADAAKRLWNTRAADSRITADDERYARELLDDLKRDDISPVAIAIKWFRKARHECVRAASDTPAPVVSSQAGEDINPDYILPCDVKLPPVTTIRKGCKLSTLLLGIRVREKHPSEFPDHAPAPGGMELADELKRIIIAQTFNLSSADKNVLWKIVETLRTAA